MKTCLKEEVSFGQQNKNALSSKEIEVNSGQANTFDKEKEVKYVYKKLMLSCPGPVIWSTYVLSAVVKRSKGIWTF